MNLYNYKCNVDPLYLVIGFGFLWDGFETPIVADAGKGEGGGESFRRTFFFVPVFFFLALLGTCISESFRRSTLFCTLDNL